MGKKKFILRHLELIGEWDKTAGEMCTLIRFLENCPRDYNPTQMQVFSGQAGKAQPLLRSSDPTEISLHSTSEIYRRGYAASHGWG